MSNLGGLSQRHIVRVDGIMLSSTKCKFGSIA